MAVIDEIAIENSEGDLVELFHRPGGFGEPPTAIDAQEILSYVGFGISAEGQFYFDTDRTEVGEGARVLYAPSTQTFIFDSG